MDAIDEGGIESVLDISRLDGRVGIVTGAGRGIGFASAKRLAEAGARVILVDIDSDTLGRAEQLISGETMIYAGDMTTPTVPADVVRAVMERWGRVDIVFNNAGYNWDAPVEEMTDEQFTAMLDIHLMGPFRLLRSLGPVFAAGSTRAAKDGAYRKVVNMSSLSGTMGNKNQVNFSAAKAGVIGMSKALAKEWGHLRVNVNVVAPGFVETRLTASRTSGATHHVGHQSVVLGVADVHREHVTELIPLGRTGSADDVARAVFFLCSPASDYITGQVLSVSGGLVFGMVS